MTPVRTAARTGLQAGLGVALMELVEAYNLYEFTDRQWAATAVLLTPLVAWIQNALEKRFDWKLLA